MYSFKSKLNTLEYIEMVKNGKELRLIKGRKRIIMMGRWLRVSE